MEFVFCVDGWFYVIIKEKEKEIKENTVVSLVASPRTREILYFDNNKADSPMINQLN